MTLEDTLGRTIEAEILKLTSDSVTFTRSDTSSPSEHTVTWDKLSQDTQNKLQELLPPTPEPTEPIELPTQTLNESKKRDLAFEQWILDWYSENLFKYPKFPKEFEELFLKNEMLRIEFFDAITFSSELENSGRLLMRHRDIVETPDNIKGIRNVISKLHKEFPQESIQFPKMVLAYSLIYDIPAKDYWCGTFPAKTWLSSLQLKWLEPFTDVFRWKTNPENMEKFIFQHEDLNIRQHTWANGSSQTNEMLDWALEQNYDTNLNNMYLETNWKKGTSTYKDIETPFGLCVGQAHVLHEKLIAWNIPNSLSSGTINTEIKGTHAFNQVLTPQKVQYAGAWENATGATVEPTNNTDIPDGLFKVHMEPEFNNPLRQRARVKTQYAQTLKLKERKNVLNDILKDYPEYGRAYALAVILGIEEPKQLSNPLDNASFYQTLVWHHIDQGETPEAIEAFKAMTLNEPDEIVRLGWAMQTLSGIKNIDIRLQLIPEIATIAPHYPGTIGKLVFKPLYDKRSPESKLVDPKNVDEIIRQTRDLHDRNKHRDFSKLIRAYAK